MRKVETIRNQIKHFNRLETKSHNDVGKFENSINNSKMIKLYTILYIFIDSTISINK